jgi:hypothetical protein
MRQNKKDHSPMFWSKQNEDNTLFSNRDNNNFTPRRADKSQKFSQKALGHFKRTIEEEMQNALEDIHSSGPRNQ